MRRFEGREIPRPTTEILSATRQDIPQIVRVEKAAVVKTYPNAEKGISARDIESTYTGAAQIWLEDIADVEKNSANKNIWVAKQDGAVVGVCIARKDKKVSIDGLYVTPHAQGTGAGTQLMEKVFEWVGPDQDINLDVVDYNEQAIKFYRKFGFEQEQGIKTEHSLTDGKSIPMIRMVKKAYKKAA